MPTKLLEPLRWAAPKSVFVNSMSDLFQDDVPDGYIEAVTKVMLRADWHTYQVLTKRADRLAHLLTTTLRSGAAASHIWWGVSVEDREYGVPRIAHLQRTRATVRFLSVEPLLEDLGQLNLEGIDWVIAGGESGHGARMMQPSWVRSIQAQCDAQGSLFFFKQWGGVNKAKTGRQLDGRTYDAIPQLSRNSPPAKAAREALVEELAPLARDWSPQPLVQVWKRSRSTSGTLTGNS